MKELYKGIIHSDRFIHNHINEILNLFDGKIVKILSNGSVAKYKWVDGVRTSEILDYDKNELNRDLNGCANILVKYQDNQNWWVSDYIYVSQSVIYENGSETPYFSIPVDLVNVAARFTNNKFLVYSRLDDLWFCIRYRDVAEWASKNEYNEKAHYSYNGYRYMKFPLDLQKGHQVSKNPHPNAKYFENVHVGVTRYSKTISGQHCFVKVFSKATGAPSRTQSGNTRKPIEFKSFTDAWDTINKWTNLSYTMSKKTFIRKIYKGELFEYNDFIFQVVISEDLLLDNLQVTKPVNTFAGIIDAFASFGVTITQADIDMANKKNMTVTEFNNYCIEKYNAAWDESALLTEAVLPEDIESVDTEDAGKSESWYRNLSIDDDKWQDLTCEERLNLFHQNERLRFQKEHPEKFDNDGEFINPFKSEQVSLF